MKSDTPLEIGKVSQLETRELTRASGEKLSLARSLSDAFGLSDLLIHLETIPPGRRASPPHHHTLKEELLLVVSGTPSVWVDGEVRRLEPGDFVGFSADDQRDRMMLNNSDAPAVIYTIGTNPLEDEVVFAPEAKALEKEK